MVDETVQLILNAQARGLADDLDMMAKRAEDPRGMYGYNTWPITLTPREARIASKAIREYYGRS